MALQFIEGGMTYAHIILIMHNSLICLMKELQMKVEYGSALCFRKFTCTRVECVGLDLDAVREETAVAC